MRSRSVLQKSRKCWVCGKTEGLEEHHIFYGHAYRRQSERYGLKVWLCAEHHRGNNGVHGRNRKLGLVLMRYAQKRFEENHTREEFIRIFGRNRLDEEEKEKKIIRAREDKAPGNFDSDTGIPGWDIEREEDYV